MTAPSFGAGPSARDLARLHQVAPAYIEGDNYARYVNTMWRSVDHLHRSHSDGDWDTYISMHDGRWRLLAFVEAVERGLTGEEYWRLLAYTYTMTDWVTHLRARYLPLFRAEVAPGRRAVMTAAELAVYDALPEQVTIWRGTTHDNRVGLSWTLERSVAEFFVRRTGGQLYTATVPRAAVLAYFAERQEAEVVVDLDALPDLAPEVAA